MYGQEEDVQELENYSLSPTSSKFRRRKGCFLSLSLRKQKIEYNLNLQYLNTLLDTNEKYLGQSSTLSKLGLVAHIKNEPHIYATIPAVASGASQYDQQSSHYEPIGENIYCKTISPPPQIWE